MPLQEFYITVTIAAAASAQNFLLCKKHEPPHMEELDDKQVLTWLFATVFIVGMLLFAYRSSKKRERGEQDY